MEPRAAEFVGRARELAELERVLGEARAGNAATVLLAGEAGIGKTRLSSELAGRARAAGFDVLVGRSLDLVGADLPYQPFVDALRTLGDPRQARVFETTITLLAERAADVPLLLVLEDLHWADTSTLDLVVRLAHNLEGPVLLLATYRADERMRRTAEGVRRSGSASVLELGALEGDEVEALLIARSHAPLSEATAKTIIARSEGNPFFAEELLAAAGDSDELPPRLRDVLLQRVSRLDDRAQGLLRAASAAGRDVTYSLVCEVAGLPEPDVRAALRSAVDHSVLVADQTAGTFRFRHALLAEAIYETILPGEREDVHAQLAEALERSNAAGPSELAPHWAAAGRPTKALVTSVAAARETEAAHGLSEAAAHLDRALALWDSVPDAAELAGVPLVDVCGWAAELASRTGNAPRAVELERRAIELVGEDDRLRASLLYERLSRYLFERGDDGFLAASERALELVPAQPPSPERARALAGLANTLQIVWQYDESLVICDEALELARTVGAREVELECLMTRGSDLAYLGRGEEGVAELERTLALAKTAGDSLALYSAYVCLTDVLTMLGRPMVSARLAEEGVEAVRPYGTDYTVLTANWIEALLAIGEWDQADEASAAAVRAITSNYPHMPLMLRADLELGRGHFDAARGHLDAARETIRHEPGLATYQGCIAELALWERRWTDANDAVRDGISRASPRWGAQIRVWLCAKGLRATAELAALARARRDADAAQAWVSCARRLVTDARTAAAEAAEITPNAAGWLALAEAEHERARGVSRPESWSHAAELWQRLERVPLAAYCSWREAEALVAAGASRVEAGVPLREAHAVALRIGANPLLREVELLAQRARLDLEPLREEKRERGSLEQALGLTPREAEVLTLVARGYTNREIAAALVISTKTAGVHVSHILEKLDAPNRREAAAIAHRVSAPGI